MATFAGKSGVLKVATNTVAELQSWTVTETGQVASDTAQGDTAQTFIVGIPTWSGSAECLWDDTDTNGQEALTIHASVTLHFQAEGDTTGDDDMTGTALVTGIDVSVPAPGADPVTRAFTFQGTGALTHSTAA